MALLNATALARYNENDKHWTGLLVKRCHLNHVLHVYFIAALLFYYLK
jgi:hypothetical protein